MSSTAVEYCHCGIPLHYQSREVEVEVTKLVDELGRFVSVQVNGITWRVDRHYIALHGLVGSEVPSLGFKRVEN